MFEAPRFDISALMEIQGLAARLFMARNIKGGPRLVDAFIFDWHPLHYLMISKGLSRGLRVSQATRDPPAPGKCARQTAAGGFRVCVGARKKQTAALRLHPSGGRHAPGTWCAGADTSSAGACSACHRSDNKQPARLVSAGERVLKQRVHRHLFAI